MKQITIDKSLAMLLTICAILLLSCGISVQALTGSWRVQFGQGIDQTGHLDLTQTAGQLAGSFELESALWTVTGTTDQLNFALYILPAENEEVLFAIIDTAVSSAPIFVPQHAEDIVVLKGTINNEQVRGTISSQLISKQNTFTLTRE